MKHIKMLIITTLLSSEFIVCKPSNKTNHHKSTTETKLVHLKMFPAPTHDIRINIVDSSTLVKPNNVMLPKDKSSVDVNINKSSHNQKIEFYIFPNSLSEYCSIPKNARKNYNPNAELPGTTGEERLLQALSTSVSYDFDSLPKEIALPNPLEILHDLLNGNC